MKPPFSLLSSHYPGNKTVSREALYQELGWQDLIQNPSYANTCAIRISVALVKCGITLRGGLVIQKGPHRGRRVEAGQARLARMLAEPAYFGKAEAFRRDDAVLGIAARKGVVAFWNIPGT
ncbi:T6SS effector amidase Tae4 family protein [Burkholderia sp. AU45274]|uniref:T6SS effector amidase Tae4 family protein n=1 Tax=Burkholderia sp. AU45274 TaxID=3059205 RepID=UPI00265A1DC7|nr:T6SS effector amidase Tae4 family protein [Burkholderia sp. AU45274]